MVRTQVPWRPRERGGLGRKPLRGAVGEWMGSCRRSLARPVGEPGIPAHSQGEGGERAVANRVVFGGQGGDHSYARSLHPPSATSEQVHCTCPPLS